MMLPFALLQVLPAEHIYRAGGEDIAIVAIIFGSLTSLLYPVIKAWTRRLDGRSGGAALPDRDTTDRLERIERAIDAMSLEVERISEGQRFVTKLMAEQAPAKLPRQGE